MPTLARQQKSEFQSADGRLGNALFPAGVCRPHQAILRINTGRQLPT
jgi:hypothetical protein